MFQTTNQCKLSWWWLGRAGWRENPQEIWSQVELWLLPFIQLAIELSDVATVRRPGPAAKAMGVLMAFAGVVMASGWKIIKIIMIVAIICHNNLMISNDNDASRPKFSPHGHCLPVHHFVVRWACCEVVEKSGDDPNIVRGPPTYYGIW